MRNPKISVIVPVYNVEKYLRRCVDSILAQTFTDFELLLIDDGSTDKSGEICDEYGRIDGRVRVFHQENGGVSKARNVGLDYAKGEWVTFCDSDDWLEADAFECYAKCVLLRNIDYFCCGYYLNGKPTLLVGDGEMPVTRCLEYNECDKLWNGVYKKDTIVRNHIRFNEKITLAEDRLFNYQYLGKCHAIYILRKCCYHYSFGNEQSLSFKGFNIDNFLECHILMYQELKGILPKKANTQFSMAFKGLIWQAICEGRILNELMSIYETAHRRLEVPGFILLKSKCIFVVYCLLQMLKHKIR